MDESSAYERCAHALSWRVGTAHSFAECVLVAGHGGWHAGEDNVGWRPWIVPAYEREEAPKPTAGGDQ